MLLKKFVPWGMVFMLASLLLYFMWFPNKIPALNDDEEETRRKILLHIEQVGKIQLLKYRLQDALEYTQTRQLIPDDKILLLVTGEAVSCIDLLKLTEQDIRHQGDTVFLSLPMPELCYVRLIQEDCKVYDLTLTKIFDKTELITSSFKQAEKHIQMLALKSDILEKSKENAILLLTPILENLTRKKVIIQFPTTLPVLR